MAERINTNPHVIQHVFKRNKNFPNSELEVLIYQGALKLPANASKAAETAQEILARNGWTNSWRNGIYDFHHYHSVTHEVIAVCKGSAEVILGGPGGKKYELNVNDVLILPAGVGHKCQQSSEDFLCVGAYPNGKDYDMNMGTEEEFDQASINILKLEIPEKDPIYGTEGFLKGFWK